MSGTLHLFPLHGQNLDFCVIDWDLVYCVVDHRLLLPCRFSFVLKDALSRL